MKERKEIDTALREMEELLNTQPLAILYHTPTAIQVLTLEVLLDCRDLLAEIRDNTQPSELVLRRSGSQPGRSGGIGGGGP